MLENNVEAPTTDAGVRLYNKFWPIVTCMQMQSFERFSHNGEYTNRLAADGSVRPTSYNFRSLGGTTSVSNIDKMTDINPY